MVPRALETWVKDTSLVFGPRELAVFVQKNLAGVIHWDDSQARSFFGGQLLPGNNIGVVFEPGDYDFVVLADVLPPPALRH